MTVLAFPSSRGRDARDNLADYVERAKALTSFVPVDWDAPVWLDVVSSATPRQSSGRTTQSLNFTIQGGARGTRQQDMIPQPLADFAKAFARHREAERPTAVNNHGIGIRAFRLLAPQMEPVSFDPCQMLPLCDRKYPDRIKTFQFGNGRCQTSSSLPRHGLIHFMHW